MSVREEFDEWAADGRDREMEGRHWHTAKHVLARMPIEPGDVVLDLGTGSGYAARALSTAGRAGRAYGLDASPEMAHNARSYTEAESGESATGTSDDVGFLIGDFGDLPFHDGTADHAFSMEAFYYAADPRAALREIHRVLRPGGTFFCAVNFYEENHYSHHWSERLGVEMTRWSREEYRRAFREAGFHVAEQDQVPDLETEIPPAEAFPTDAFETREAMVERYRELGTLLTVGVVP